MKQVIIIILQQITALECALNKTIFAIYEFYLRNHTIHCIYDFIV